MGKARPDKMDVDEVTRHGKKDKKQFELKIDKPDHEQKSNTAEILEDDSTESYFDVSDDESLQVGRTSPEKAQDAALAPPRRRTDEGSVENRGNNSQQGSTEEGSSSLSNSAAMAPIKDVESKAARRQRMQYEKLREEARMILMKRETGSSFTALALHLEAEKERKRRKRLQKKKEKRGDTQLKERAVAETPNDLATDGGSLFMIDASPTPVDPKKLRSPISEEDENTFIGAVLTASVTQGAAPSDMTTRAARRRLKLIENAKARNQRKLGVPIGSDEEAIKMQKHLDKWFKKKRNGDKKASRGRRIARWKKPLLWRQLSPFRRTRSRRVMTNLC